MAFMVSCFIIGVIHTDTVYVNYFEQEQFVTGLIFSVTMPLNICLVTYFDLFIERTFTFLMDLYKFLLYSLLPSILCSSKLFLFVIGYCCILRTFDSTYLSVSSIKLWKRHGFEHPGSVNWNSSKYNADAYKNQFKINLLLYSQIVLGKCYLNTACFSA